ncbi:uncharacterized protein TRIVIDRAFT_225030 [Trichoderma virens Gv29-8]|uniref:Hydrophobin n=1 Tax=Hypocrea virens (strain Gv29-8 / FGSC 10586) TaxID=413071 RepID=G9N241_HYPVG|nr:uncharacterized protein TRIVIDRAFT_225030 [Trichoderma virens Gv29-8]EHK19157.1 hypothetical protein TRIVIDRAFT_225030 [Trichoderma virens Gv29-8]UKZ49390.1 hypothetical protein TrVGV298_003637 [Trichoderma virens]
MSQPLLALWIVALLISLKTCRGGDYCAAKISAGLLQATCHGIPGLIVPYPAMCHFDSGPPSILPPSLAAAT